jgi:tRNA pseudouridine38-40 synthase
MRVAYKLAYIGTNFHGFQYQPNVRTVAGELFKAFRNLGIDVKKAKFRCAGRTDAGVHAFGQVIALNMEKLIFPRVLNAHLPEDITVWAWSEVNDDFNPRKAKRRTYMYVLPAKGYDISAMRKASKLLLGTHDFSNFTKKFGERRRCVRTIYDVELRVDDGFVILEIVGNAFTWNMVRCIVSALSEVGSGHRTLEWFKDMLDPERHRERIEPAPAYGLILKDVEYEDVNFEIDEYAWKTLMGRIKSIVEFHGTIYKLFSQFGQD